MSMNISYKRQIKSITSIDELSIRRLKLKRKRLVEDIIMNEEDGYCKIYKNQERSAKEVKLHLDNNKIINVMVLAQTQSGKTGGMIALLKEVFSSDDIMISPDNVYIISGLSSNNWVNQTMKRIPEILHKNVYHRNKLNKFIEDIEGKEDILILIDEVQIAAKDKQSMYKMFNKGGLYDIEHLCKKNIKIVEFTATPNGTLYDHINWGENSKRVILDPGDGYTSCMNLFNSDRVLQYENLKLRRKVGELKREILKRYNGNKLYHIIRTPVGKEQEIVINNFTETFGMIDYRFIKYDMGTDVQDINKIVKAPPLKHTFIFIKEMLRCSKTLNKKNIGVMYERYTSNPLDDVIIQGLLGRSTGYDDNGKLIVYTNIDSIFKYEELWASMFYNKKVKWRSSTTKTMKNTHLISKGTFINKEHFVEGERKEGFEEKENEPFIKKFNDFESAKKYVKEDLGNKRGPNNPSKNINSDGFYECNIRGTKKVWSTNEIYNERKCNIKNGAGYGFRYCYEDINDKSTLQFWIIHY